MKKQNERTKLLISGDTVDVYLVWDLPIGAALFTDYYCLLRATVVVSISNSALNSSKYPLTVVWWILE